MRDILLGRTPLDVDLAVAGDALALGRELAQAVGGRFVALKEAHATCRVVGGGVYWDLAGLRAPDLVGDLKARDFTVNAMAWELEAFVAGQGELIDPTGGEGDLAAGLLRPAGPGVLAADPLRVLRAFRFVATHGLELAPGVDRRLAAQAPGLAGVARERVGQEWLALMAGSQAAPGIRGLETAGGLGVLVPELEAGRGLEQNPYHHLDVLEHNLACLEELGRIAARPGELMGPFGDEVAAYLAPAHTRALVMTTALLHDLGKPSTRQATQPGWATFHRHDTRGARLARQAVRDLGLSKADGELIARLVGDHMRPFHLLGAVARDGITPRAVRRLLEAAGEHLPGLFALAMADTLAGKGPLRPPEAEERLLALYGQVAAWRDEWLAAALAAPPLVDGHQVMAALGLDSGPYVGRILAALREAQLEGEVATTEEALALARRLHQQGLQTG